MGLLVASHRRFLEHDTGLGHPERPTRLGAVERGLTAAGLSEAITTIEPEPASIEDLARVHPETFVGAVERFCTAGGGQLDADTRVGPLSYEAARLAAGSGLVLADRLRAGEGEAGFCLVRPPGHHARPTQAMGFCLFNNIAVVAAALAERGERVLIVDYDAHHGNGTQEAFLRDPRVLYASMHEWPLYPGTGSLLEVGEGAGRGATVNLPFPAGATGDVYRRAVAEVVAPASEVHGTTWLLVSAGFDAHRADPLTGLGLTAGDYADITADLLALAPSGRRLFFLEGGYDLDALSSSSGATFARVLGVRYRPEAPSSGGPGGEVVAAALNIRQVTADG